ncbi:MAG: glycerophosphodiester phosphodiesterase [Myxococcales bacterium]|nr:glycerophosphodiester phosphodiesterase [Myxococcales bacterium]
MRAHDLPFLRGLVPTLHIAHRGGAGCFPENTLAAFGGAIALGATMLELDVHLSADGEVVVCHDDTLDRCTDATGPVSARTARELAQVDAGYHFALDGAHPWRGRGCGIPRLAEVLARWPDVRLNIELKSADPLLIPAFLGVLDAAGARDRTCMGSEQDAVAEALFAAAPDACHYQPRGPLTAWVMAAVMGTARPRDDRWAVVDMPLAWQGTPLVTPGLVAAARADGLWVNVWTVDEEADMARLKALGVGGIMTDRPDRLARVLAS